MWLNAARKYGQILWVLLLASWHCQTALQGKIGAGWCAWRPVCCVWEIVSVDWNNWPQVPIAVAKTLQHQFFFLPTSFLSPPMFCGICSYHAHASSSKGSSCARIRKEHNQGIGGCCSIPPKRKHIHEYSFGIQSLRRPHCCYPLGLTFFILRKMNARTFNETITASNCTTSLAHTIAFDTQNGG